MIKLFITLLLIVSTVKANVPYQLYVIRNNQGSPFVYIKNFTQFNVRCSITGNSYYKEFYLPAYGSSRYYPEPYGHYKWYCR